MIAICGSDQFATLPLATLVAFGSAEKLFAIRRYLGENGEWNDHRPFRDDLDDPPGEKPAKRLLQRYLDHWDGDQRTDRCRTSAS